MHVITSGMFESFLTPDMASKLMPDMASIGSVSGLLDLALFFDVMSGVKKLSNFTPAITYPALALVTLQFFIYVYCLFDNYLQ